MLRKLLSNLLFLVLLAGCGQSVNLESFAAPEDQAFAKETIDLLRAHRYDDIEKKIDSSVLKTSLRPELIAMAGLMPAGEPTSIKLVGAHHITTNGTLTTNLTYEYGFSGKWILTNVAARKVNSATTIVGFTVVPQPVSLEETSKFSISGKSGLHYFILAMLVVFPLLTLYALVVCIKTRLKGRKWPWLIFICLGFGKLTMNWFTGEWAYMPLAFQLFSASGVSAAPFGPWIFSISLPLGAITFLAMRKRLSAT